MRCARCSKRMYSASSPSRKRCCHSFAKRRRRTRTRAMFGTYSWSKTALNAITVAFASELEPDGIKVNAACPGFTSTDLNNFQGTRTVEQAAREPVRLALLDADGPTGTFSNENGPLPW